MDTLLYVCMALAVLFVVLPAVAARAVYDLVQTLRHETAADWAVRARLSYYCVPRRSKPTMGMWNGISGYVHPNGRGYDLVSSVGKVFTTVPYDQVNRIRYQADDSLLFINK